jgi:single-stranded DNA-binding protein
LPAAVVLRAGLHSVVRRPADAVVNDTVWSWDRLAEISGTSLGKGRPIAFEDRLQTRSWDDAEAA